jgi:hypothetical protein
MSIVAGLSRLFQNGPNVYVIWQQPLCVTAFSLRLWGANELQLCAI